MKVMKYLDVSVLALGCLLASSCAAPIDMRLSGSGAGLSPPARLTVLTAEPDGAPANKELQALVEKSLAARGYAFAEDGNHILDVAYSQRAGSISVFENGGLKPRSPAQKKSLFSSCAKQVHRVTLVVLERASGTPLYQGTAEEAHCKGTAADHAPHLIDALAADIAKPGGERLLTRKAARK